MDNILKKAESIDLSGEDLMNICNNKVEIIPYHTLGSYDSIENLLSKHGAVILLYETKREDYGHYVALFYNNNNDLEFFDSYGMKADEELKYADYNLKEGIPFLTNLLKKYNKKVVMNTMRLQTFHNDINTCGRWTSCRIRWRDTSLREFQRLMTDNANYHGDMWVSALTFLYTKK